MRLFLGSECRIGEVAGIRKGHRLHERGYFTRREERYDIIFDAVGKSAKSVCKRALTPNGTYLTVDGQGMAKVRNEDLLLLKELMETGKIKAVIDRIYPLQQVPDAYRYVEQGRKRGNVVITVEHDIQA